MHLIHLQVNKFSFKQFLIKRQLLTVLTGIFSFVNEIIYLNKATNLTCTPTFLNMLIINAKIQNHTLKNNYRGGRED